MMTRPFTLRAHLHSNPSVGTLAPSRAFVLVSASLTIGLLVGGCDSQSTTVPSALAAMTQAPSMSVGVGQRARPGDSAAVAGVAAAWDAAWNAGDGPAIGALFIEDGELINARGQLVVGSATIRANHITNLAGAFRGSHSQGAVRRITFLSENAAFLEVDNTLTGTFTLPGGAVPTFPGKNLARHNRVVVKRDGRWRIMSMQITFRAAGTVTAPAP